MSASSQRQQPASFGRRLARFAGRLIGLVLVGVALIVVSTMTEGALHWVTLVLGVAVMLGVALYGNALSAETQRKLCRDLLLRIKSSKKHGRRTGVEFRQNPTSSSDASSFP